MIALGLKKYWVGTKPTGWIQNELMENYFIGMLTIMLRRQAYELLQEGFDPRLHVIGDFDLTTRIAANWQIGCIQQPIANFRFHGNNESVQRLELHVKELETWVKEKSLDKSISSMPGYQHFCNHVIYHKALLSIDRKEYWKLLRHINKLLFS